MLSLLRHHYYLSSTFYATNDALALQLLCDEEPFTTASVNIESANLGPDEICIKDYSENEDMLDWLLKHKIVEPPHRFIPSGFVTIPICKYLGIAHLTDNKLPEEPKHD